MDIIPCTFDGELNNCIDVIDELKKRLSTAEEAKNNVLVKMANFYTNHLKGVYFKCTPTNRIGQICNVSCTNGKFFVHLWVLEFTSKSKFIKQYLTAELFGDAMKCLVQISESEYKQEFFDYINERIKMVESE